MSYLDKALRHKKELLWVLAGQGMVVLGGFVGIKALTNMIGPEGYGQLALGLTVSGLVTTFLFSPFGQVVMRYFSLYNDRKSLGVYFYVVKKIFTRLSLIALVAGSCAICVAYVWGGSTWAMLTGLGFVYGVVSGYGGIFTGIQNAVRQRKVLALHQGAEAWLRIGLALGMMMVLKTTGAVALGGYLAASAVVSISQRRFMLKNEAVRKEWASSAGQTEEDEARRQFFEYGFPFVVWAFFGVVTAYADRWILNGYMGVREVGIYAALFQIASVPIGMVLGLVSQFVAPILFERAGDRVVANVLFRKVLAFSSALVLCVSVPVAIFAREIILLLTNPEFAEYYKLLWLLLAGAALFNMGQIFALKGMCFNKTKIYIFPKVAHAVLFLISAIVLTKIWGIYGMGLSLIFPSAIYLVLMGISNSRLGDVERSAGEPSVSSPYTAEV